METPRVSLSDEEILQRLGDLPHWSRVENALVRVQTFPYYRDALEFVQRVGLAAEEADHHPDIFMNFKRVTVRYWTHRARGITELDFKMAHLVEKLVRDTYHPRAASE